MFHTAGSHKVTITQAFLGDAKFNNDPGAFDVILKVEDVDGNSDYWRGEWSAKFGVGSVSDKQQHELTQATLNKLGMVGNLFDQGIIQPDQDDVPVIPCMLGIETVVTTEASKPTADGKVFYNVKSIGGSGKAPTALKFSTFFGTAPAQQQQAPAQQAVQQAPPQQQMQQAPPQQQAVPQFPGTAPAQQQQAPAQVPPAQQQMQQPPAQAPNMFANLQTPPQG